MKKNVYISLLILIIVFSFRVWSFVNELPSLITKESAGEFIDEKSDYWPDIVEEIRKSKGSVSRSLFMSRDMRVAFKDSELSKVSYNEANHSVVCRFSPSVEPYVSIWLEYNTELSATEIPTTWKTVYWPDWTQAENSETIARWEGGGADRKGYIIIEEIRPDWFYIEMYSKQ